MFEALLAAALAQAAPAQTPPSDEVVVEGLRDIDQPGSPVTHKTLGTRSGAGARRGRATFQIAERFARCAVKDGGGGLDALRRTLDGVVNGAGQRFWQARLVQIRATCAQDASVARQAGVAVVDPLYDTSYYERGALFLRALELFAPDLKLTARQTADPAVQARLNARETPLARFRLPADRQYFETAICFVRLQPELAVQPTRTDEAETIARIEAAMVNRAKPCVGGAKQVYFDPTQFRFYIADAVYRWAVAARGSDSLIPR